MKYTQFVGKSDFESRILNSDSPKIVVFAASWCGYCRRFLDLLDSLEDRGEVTVVDVDDPDESLWDEFKIPLVPTLIVFHRGKEIFRQNGRAGVGLLKGDVERALAAYASAR